MKVYVLAFLLALPMTINAQPQVRYSLGMSKPHTHLFEVEVKIDRIPSSLKEISLVMPAWRTGRYVLFDFAGGVVSFHAVSAGRTLEITKTDKQTWRIKTNGASSVTASYEVYANEINQRTRGLNDEHGFVDPATLFMFLQRYDHLPVSVKIHPFGQWHVTTGLDSDPREPNLFVAPNYQHFADCPIEIGMQRDIEFTAGGKKHVLMVAGETNGDPALLIPDITRIVEANKQFWGKLPYDRYIFMIHFSPQGGGGTEHLNSTIMQSRPFNLNKADARRGFMGLVSHEYFHTWNVKQLRPAAFRPYDFTKENYSRELWIAEGTTSYYGSIMLMRAGFMTADQYKAGIPANVQGDRMRPGNSIQSPNDASYDAWIKYWKGTQQSFNMESDYYDRGSDVSLILDLEIRQRSNNKHSLDDVMKTMFERFPLAAKGYTVDDFENICSELAGSSLKQFFADYVDGTKPLPWEQALSYAGFELKPHTADLKPWLGIQTNDVNGAARINRVVAGSPAYDAGLDIGDDILALNGFRITSGALSARIAEMNTGDTASILLFREEKLRVFDVPLSANPVVQYDLSPIAQPTELQKAIAKDWLMTGF